MSDMKYWPYGSKEEKEKIDRQKHPFKNEQDRYEELTIGRLKSMLEELPDDFVIKYDSFMASIQVGNMAVDYEGKEISING